MIRLGRFTARGGPQVEAFLRHVVSEAARIAGDVLSPREARAVVLMGGYGRGEGGVQVVDGVERPHNNLDFLLITRGLGLLRTDALRHRLSEALQPLARRAGIGIDVGAVSDLGLWAAPCRVMWYDARFGHQAVWGDASFLPSLQRFTADAILPSDVRDLVVNRGTLLVIDDALADLPDPTPGTRMALVRHAVKAILGYGDGLLFSRGAYHWSYLERQRRMAARDDVDAGFRALYDAAMEHRFRPDPGPWQGRDLRAWLEEVRHAVEPVHLEFEARRLADPALTWADYPGRATLQALGDGLAHPREAARRAKALWLSLGDLPWRAAPGPARNGDAPSGRKEGDAWGGQGEGDALGGGWEEAARRTGGTGGPSGRLSRLPGMRDLAWRLVPPRDRLGILFPVVAYRLRDPAFRDLARATLAAGDEDRALRRAFLRAWGVHGDPNFGAAATRLGLAL